MQAGDSLRSIQDFLEREGRRQLVKQQHSKRRADFAFAFAFECFEQPTHTSLCSSVAAMAQSNMASSSQSAIASPLSAASTPAIAHDPLIETTPESIVLAWKGQANEPPSKDDFGRENDWREQKPYNLDSEGKSVVGGACAKYRSRGKNETGTIGKY